MNEFDVIVVGGGPAGTTTATLCAQHGLSVALFEHARFPRHKVCGDVINPNCWPVLERLGVAEKVRALPRCHLTGATFSAKRAVLHVDHQHTNGGPLTAIRRSLFDTALLEHAKSSGVAVFEHDTVHGLTAGREVVASSGRYISLECIIGADGRHSVVAQAAGLARKPSRQSKYIAFQAQFTAPKRLDDRVQLHLFPGGYCGLVRVDERFVNLCIITNRQLAGLHHDCEALFAHTVHQNPHFRALGIAPGSAEPLHSAHPLSTPASLPAGNGVLLVGDALRVMEPFTGQGIFFALRTAELAADAILHSQEPETHYTASVTELYRSHARTNNWLQPLMYRHRAAGFVIGALRHWPRMLSGLADNVLGAA
jgi:flavin-dependent dehydrogenase